MLDRPEMGRKQRRSILLFTLAATCAILFIQLVTLNRENENDKSFEHQKQEFEEESPIGSPDDLHHHARIFTKATQRKFKGKRRFASRTSSDAFLLIGKITSTAETVTSNKSNKGKGNSDIIFI